MKSRIVLISLLAVLIVVGAGLTWLLRSESGLRWLFTLASPRGAGGELTVDRLDGRLVGPIELHGLRFRSQSTDVDLAHLSLDWSPWALLAGRLHVHYIHAGDLAVRTRPRPGRPSRGPWPTIRLPVALEVDELKLARIAFRHADAEQRTLVEHVTLSASSRGGRLLVEQLDADGPHFRLNAHGDLLMRPPYDINLEVSWRLDLPDYAAVEAQGSAHGNRDRLVLRQTASAPMRLDIDAELLELHKGIHWKANVAAEPFTLRSIHKKWPEVRVHGQIEAHGDAQNLTAKGNIGVRHQQLPPLSADLSFKQNGRQWEIDHLLVRSQQADIRLEGTASGEWLPESPTIQAAITWRALAWPLHGAPLSASPRGAASLSGTFDNYRVVMDADLIPHRVVPMLHVNARGRGDREQLRFDYIAGSGLDGSFRAQGALTFRPTLSWQAQYAAQNVDPGTIWSHWRGGLALRGDVQGAYDRQLSLDVSIAEIAGKIREQDVNAVAALEVRGRHYRIPKLELHSGDSRLRLNGDIKDRWNLHWSMEQFRLATWTPARGSLSGSGSIVGSRAAPRVQAQLQASDVAWATHRMRRANLRADVDLNDERPSSLVADMQGLTLFDQAFDQAQITLVGHRSDHRFTLDTGSVGDHLRLVLHGDLKERAWDGRLERFDLKSQLLGQWTLTEPGPLRYSATAVELGQWCWQYSDSRLCTRGRWRKAGGSEWQAQAERVPLALLQPIMGSDTRFSGHLNGELDSRTGPDGQLTARAQIEATSGEISYLTPSGARVSLRHSGGQFRADAAERRLRTRFFWIFDEDGYLDGNLQIPFAPFESVDLSDVPLNGGFDAILLDLSALPAIFPYLENTHGTLRMDLRFGGTAGRPSVKGKVALEEGVVEIPRLGIRLEDTYVTAHSDDGKLFKLDGRTRSGDGVVFTSGEFALGTPPDWTAELKLRGENFQVIKIPEAWVQVSPDVSVKLQPHRVEADGRLHVPRGRISPKDLTQAALPSSDVVMRGEHLSEPDRRWDVSSRITLALGDQVRFQGFNVDATITGQITAREEPQRPTTGRGELRVTEGRYKVYGQELKIDRGRLIFAGGPITDPGLDMRATREVGDVLAGVQVRGTLRAPVLTLFSEPAMNQTDALSYLILGRPVSQVGGQDGSLLTQAAASLGVVGGEFLATRLGTRFGVDEVRIDPGKGQDDASVVFGTHLSPRLYINYGIGLFEPVNTLRVRYRIGRHWTLQTESGAHQGADLLYSIER